MEELMRKKENERKGKQHSLPVESGSKHGGEIYC